MANPEKRKGTKDRERVRHVFRRESKKGILILLILEGAACGIMLLSPFLAVGGVATWFLAMLTQGKRFDAIGLSPLYMGAWLVIAGACFAPLSVFSLVFAVLQQRRFKTPLALPTAITAGVHLVLTIFSVSYLWRL